MKIVIIDAIIKTLKVLAITLLSFINIEKTNIGINNIDLNKGLVVVNDSIPYDTKYVYSSKIPTGIYNTLVSGEEGIIYFDEKENSFKTLKEKIDEVIEVGIGPEGEYKGIVTGYGPDCETCDGRGYVACATPKGKWTNLYTDGNFYEDPVYGKLQILAADFRQFPCGTIIEVNNNDLSNPILGVVLDTGSAMRWAYEHNYVHIDVAFKTEVGLRFNTNVNTSFSVKRWGW